MSLSSHSLGTGGSGDREGRVKDITKGIREREFLSDNGTVLPNSFQPKVSMCLCVCLIYVYKWSGYGSDMSIGG